MQIDGDPRTKMAEELDRVRISAAELRAEASTLVTRRGNVKEVREDKRHKQRDGKRPDMQRYQPSAGHKRKDSVETDDPQQAPSQTEQSAPAVDEAMSKKDMPVLGTDRPHSNAKHSVHRDATHQEDALLSDADLSNVSFESGGPETSGRKGVVVKDGQGSDPGLPTSPKHARKARKPDRQIYQAGGRWAKGGKDSAPNHKDSEKGGKDSAPNHKDSEKGGKDSAPNHKDSEKGGVDAEASGPSGEMEKGSREAELGHKDGGGRESERALTAAPPGDLEDSRGAAEPQGKGRGERGRGRRSKDSNRKQEPGRPRRDGGGPGLVQYEDRRRVDTLASRVEKPRA
ncbi:telomerase-binding protein EST1A-like [Alosa alosa]|uniref:telomerase-binding protein EST1A-like n=1 Tax=Alosa alosa TaxID=278164 RepID=UPI0020153557|nr:telomerase-binding protein EST1A-like [Alosa alosa]